mmetsp:Transcript_17535/g.20218  ORF Transcript_17535/g.20218 Transcript_17535/m.20218 type:complete len:536 (-) Transcript_17535:374-1981(-)
MYNGVGLSSVRGTATSGHVQANRSHVRPSQQRWKTTQNLKHSSKFGVEIKYGKNTNTRDSGSYSRHREQRVDTISEEDRVRQLKRDMETRLLVLRDQLEESGEGEILINERIEKERIIRLDSIEKEIERKKHLENISKIRLQANVEKGDGVSVGKNVNNASSNTAASEPVHGDTVSSPVAPDSSITASLPIHPVNEEVKNSKPRDDFSNNQISRGGERGIGSKTHHRSNGSDMIEKGRSSKGEYQNRESYSGMSHHSRYHARNNVGYERRSTTRNKTDRNVRTLMKEDENKRLRDAIGISGDFVEGAAFNRELQQERKKARRDIIDKRLKEETTTKKLREKEKKRKDSEQKAQSRTRRTERDRSNVMDRNIKENFRRRGRRRSRSSSSRRSYSSSSGSSRSYSSSSSRSYSSSSQNKRSDSSFDSRSYSSSSFSTYSGASRSDQSSKCSRRSRKRSRSRSVTPSRQKKISSPESMSSGRFLSNKEREKKPEKCIVGKGSSQRGDSSIQKSLSRSRSRSPQRKLKARNSPRTRDRR